ncbi:MAG TPA: pitrilysin family protein [Candidatus Binatia bacterium]|nr:pitrilysin family protein [Candidatus Binatia bacterium]
MRLWAAIGLLALLAGGARAAEELRLPPVTRATLPNGMRLVVAEYHELPLVELYAIVGAGAAQDPAGKEGLAQLVAASLKRGAGGLSAEALARAIESLGGTVTAAAGSDGTTLTAEFLSSDFSAGLDLVRRVLLEPAFDKDEVRRARDEQAAGIVAALEDPSAVADKCFAAFLYGTYAYGRPVEGRRASVAKLDRGDVRTFYDRWYRPNDTILVLVGDVGAPEAERQLAGAFGAWTPRPDAVAARAPAPPRWSTRRVLLVDEPDATQTQIRFGNLSIARAAPDWLPAQVANTILGGGFTSQLIEELRIKRSLTYAAWSMFSARLMGGDFRIGTFTKTPTSTETLALALDVLGAFRTHAPDAKALEKAKTYLRGQFPLRLETPDALAARLAEIEFQGLPRDELETFRGRVAGVSADEVLRVAQADMPPPDAVAVVVVGKGSAIRAPLEARLGPVSVVSPDACEDPASLPRP